MQKSVWLLSLVLALPMASSADFTNPSFELPALNPGDQLGVSGNAQLPGWNVSFAAVITNQFVGDLVTWNPTPDGNQFLYINPNLNPGSLLSQSVGLSAGSHTLNFLQADFGSQFDLPGGEIQVSVLDSSQNVVVAPQVFSTNAFSGYITQTLTFNVTQAATYEVDFTSIARHAAIIDGVHMDTTPEPTTLLALGSGIALVALRRFKRRR